MNLRAETVAAQEELAAWLEHQPEPIRSIAAKVYGGLGSTLIGAKPNRKTVEMLRDDVAELAAARGIA